MTRHRSRFPRARRALPRALLLTVVAVFLQCRAQETSPARQRDLGANGVPDAGVSDAAVPVDSAGAVDGAGSSDGAGGTTSDAGEPAVTTLSFQASDEDFFNPERGMLDQLDMTDTTALTNTRANGHSLVWSYVRLDSYRAGPIDATFLATVDAAFAQVRSLGMKVIVRFAYNAAQGDPDAPLAIVLGHIGQLKPLLQKNGDVLAMLQAGFIGAWGEWHDSTNGLTTLASRQAITNALLDAVPANRELQIRTPAEIQDQLGGPLAPALAFSGQPLARIGLHNDCFLASDDDLGTYFPPPIQPWRDYFAAQSLFAPVGGETCAANPPRSDCATALAELAGFHYSWLNSDYEPTVLSSWTTQGCMATIHRLIGYRIAVTSAAVNLVVRPGGILDLTVALHNGGYAALYNARPVYAVLLGADGTRYQALLGGVDPRRWAAAADAQLHTRLRVPATAPAGTYRLALWLPDQATALQDRVDYSLRFANQGTWDATLGLNTLTPALLITPDAPGMIDPSATTFAAVP
jgi:hypothetical protein